MIQLHGAKEVVRGACDPVMDRIETVIYRTITIVERFQNGVR